MFEAYCCRQMGWLFFNQDGIETLVDVCHGVCVKKSLIHHKCRKEEETNGCLDLKTGVDDA